MIAPSRRASVLALLLLLLLPATAGAQDAAEWFPTPDSRPLNGGLAVDADGSVFYGLGTVSPEINPFVGKLDPATGTTKTYPTYAPGGESCCATQVRDIAIDRTQGRVYYTKSTGLAVVTDRTFTTQDGAFVTGKGDLGDIAAVANGAWFAEYFASNATGWPGNRMAFLSAQAGLNELPALSEYTGTHVDSRYDAKPRGVTIAPDGSPWFTEADAGNPGYRIAKVTGATYDEHTLLCVSTTPCSGTYTGRGPTSIAAAPDGTLWFTNQVTNTFGRFDPNGNTMSEYPLSGPLGLAGGTPYAVRAAPDGAIWLIVRAPYGGTQNAAVRIVPQTTPGTDPTATVTPLGVQRSPLSLGIGADGTVWVGASDQGNAGAWVGRLTGTAGTAPPPAGGGGGGGGTGGGGTGGGGTPITLPGATKPPVVVKPKLTGVAKVQNPTIKGNDLSATQICVGPPADKCSVVYLLQTHEYVTGFPGTTAAFAAKRKKRKTRLVAIGTKKVTLNGGQKKRVTVSLNKRGRKLLKRDGKLNATFVVKQRTAAGKLVKVKAKKVRFKR